MKIDLDSLTYLEEEVDSEQIERIIEGIKKSWLDTMDTNFHIFDCKILHAHWVSNISALKISEYCDPECFDNNYHNVIEAKYCIWVTPGKDIPWTPEPISRITNTIYCYKFSDGAEYPYTLNFIREIEHDITDGNIVSTELPEVGIQELLDYLENESSADILAEMNPEELPENLNPRIRELHERLHTRFLIDEAEYEESSSEEKMMVLDFAATPCSQSFEITLPSKYQNFFFVIKLLYFDQVDKCDELYIEALPPFRHVLAKRDPVWKHTITIPPVNIKNAGQYLRDWVENSENLELLRSYQITSRREKD